LNGYPGGKKYISKTCGRKMTISHALLSIPFSGIASTTREMKNAWTTQAHRRVDTTN
jgi:hypothetical protein